MNRTLTSDTICFDAPATEWLEALPVGSGRLGGMVFGGICHETVCINEDTLWCGKPETGDGVFRPKDNGRRPGEWAAQVAEASRSRKYVAAYDIALEVLSTGGDTKPYSFFGNLTIDIQNSDGQNQDSSEACVTGYRRFLDMSDATVRSEYTDGGNRIVRCCYASVPDDCIVYEIYSQKPINISIGMNGGCLTEVCKRNGTLTGFGHCYANSPDEKDNVIKYAGSAGIFTNKALGPCVEAEGVTTATVILRVVTNYRSIIENGDTSAPDATGCAVEYLPERLFERHLEEYTQYYNRVRLELGEENTIYSTLFNYGRYLMISASRTGSQPANLQGIWNNSLTPPWNGNYTININTQMNYWLTGPCALHEMTEPLLNMMEELCESGKRTAREYYGVEGTCAFHNTNLWRKSTSAWGSPMWNCWPLGSQWLCRNLFEECLFSQDYEFMLRTEKVMRENLRFCLNMAVKTPKGFALCPGTSPENEFWWRDDSPEISLNGVHVNHPKSWDDWMAISDDGCRKVAVAEYSENENAIFRNLCRDYIDLCEMIDARSAEAERADNEGVCRNPLCESSIYRQAEKILPEIIPVQTDSRGRIMEWNEEMPECDEHHRHLSHLYELHPGRGITEKDKELFTAVRKSLESRGDEGTGWSLAWKLLMWARMKDGAHEEGLLRMFVRSLGAGPVAYGGGGGIYPNMFCAHPPFQIDGNYGISAGIAEMLVQSHEDYIHILPALPPSWKKGSVKGLKCRGGLTVDVAWDGGTGEGQVKVDFDRSTSEIYKSRDIKYRIGNGPVLTETRGRNERDNL